MENLRRALTLTHIGVMIVDVDSGDISWDDTMYSLHGVSRSEFTVTAESSIEFVHPDDKARMIDAVTSVFATQQVELEYRIRRADGETIYVRSCFEARAANDVRGLTVVGTVQDITHEVETRKALGDATNLATLILETLPDSVIVVNHDGDICASNARWRESVGVENALNYFELLHEFLPSMDLDASAVWAAVESMKSGTAEPIVFEYPQELDGETRWHRSTSQPLLGSHEHFMVVFSDVTAHRAAVADTIHAQKLEAVGQLAAGIAHEINTPIQFIGDNLRFVGDAMGSLLELIETYEAVGSLNVSPHERALLDARRGDADIDFLRAEVPEAVTQALGGVDRVATIVRALKSFGHPGDPTQQQSADINEIIKTTIIVAQNELKYVAALHCNFGDIPAVRCYPSDLNQVFLNLLVNAAHAVAEVCEGTDHQGSITVATFQDGDDVVVTIADTGGGIPDAIQHRIFEPFFTTKGVGRGTGQGLAIARSIIFDRHGGRLSFETMAGVGTTFRVSLAISGTNGSQRQ